MIKSGSQEDETRTPLPLHILSKKMYPISIKWANIFPLPAIVHLLANVRNTQTEFLLMYGVIMDKHSQLRQTSLSRNLILWHLVSLLAKCYMLEKNRHRCELQMRSTIPQLVNMTITEPTREILCTASSLRVIMAVESWAEPVRTKFLPDRFLSATARKEDLFPQT